MDVGSVVCSEVSVIGVEVGSCEAPSVDGESVGHVTAVDEIESSAYLCDCCIGSVYGLS